MTDVIVEVNGKSLDEQPTALDTTRKYCDTCRFSQVWLGGAAIQLMCRRRPPQAIGSFMGVNSPNGVVPQLFSQTVWPIITKEDWCGDHQDDPKQKRGGGAGKVVSVIDQDTSRAS